MIKPQLSKPTKEVDVFLSFLSFLLLSFLSAFLPSLCSSLPPSSLSSLRCSFSAHVPNLYCVPNPVPGAEEEPGANRKNKPQPSHGLTVGANALEEKDGKWSTVCPRESHDTNKKNLYQGESETSALVPCAPSPTSHSHL